MPKWMATELKKSIKLMSMIKRVLLSSFTAKLSFQAATRHNICKSHRGALSERRDKAD